MRATIRSMGHLLLGSAFLLAAGCGSTAEEPADEASREATRKFQPNNPAQSSSWKNQVLPKGYLQCNNEVTGCALHVISGSETRTFLIKGKPYQTHTLKILGRADLYLGTTAVGYYFVDRPKEAMVSEVPCLDYPDRDTALPGSEPCGEFLSRAAFQATAGQRVVYAVGPAAEVGMPRFPWGAVKNTVLANTVVTCAHPPCNIYSVTTPYDPADWEYDPENQMQSPPAESPARVGDTFQVWARFRDWGILGFTGGNYRAVNLGEGSWVGWKEPVVSAEPSPLVCQLVHASYYKVVESHSGLKQTIANPDFLTPLCTGLLLKQARNSPAIGFLTATTCVERIKGFLEEAEALDPALPAQHNWVGVQCPGSPAIYLLEAIAGQPSQPLPTQSELSVLKLAQNYPGESGQLRQEEAIRAAAPLRFLSMSFNTNLNEASFSYRVQHVRYSKGSPERATLYLSNAHRNAQRTYSTDFFSDRRLRDEIYSFEESYSVAVQPWPVVFDYGSPYLLQKRSFSSGEPKDDLFVVGIQSDGQTVKEIPPQLVQDQTLPGIL